MLNKRQRLGQGGELYVAKYLKNEGYRILAKNYRCKVGEIDIIARDGKELVFIEVKTRSGLSHGSPAAAVDFRKQRQISRTAQWYLAEQTLSDPPARFDVISVLYDEAGQLTIEHIRDAFDLCE